MTATASPPAFPPSSQPGRAVVVATVLGVAAYFVLLHALVVSRALPLLTLALVVAPWGVAIGSVLLAAKRAPATKAFAGGLAVAAAIVAWRYAKDLAAHADELLYLENLAFLAGLAGLFANSVRGSGDAFITRLARIARNGDMPPAVVAYTRAVTVAWALFFAVAALVSTVLFATQSRTAWSTFVNLLLGPLTGVAFVVEYAVRIRLLRGVDHVSLMTGFTTFRRHGRAHEPGEPS